MNIPAASGGEVHCVRLLSVLSRPQTVINFYVRGKARPFIFGFGPVFARFLAGCLA
jgi:hypothetical protein